MTTLKRSQITHDQIVAAYRELKSTARTAAALGIGETTVLRVLTIQGIERTGLIDHRRSITKFLGQEAEIRTAYEAGATMAQLSERFGTATHYAFKHAIKRAGGHPRPNPIPPASDDERATIISMYEAGDSHQRISIAIGRSQRFVSKLLRSHGFKPKKPTGPNHPNWSGGRSKAGPYWRVHLDPTDPFYEMATQGGTVLEHRIVMARTLGRALLPTETVHHINGDCGDNRAGNLQLRQGRHGKGTVMCCLDCGSQNIGRVKIGRITITFD